VYEVRYIGDVYRQLVSCHCFDYSRTPASMFPFGSFFAWSASSIS